MNKQALYLSNGKRLLLPIAYMMTLLLLSSIPGDQSAAQSPASQVSQYIAPTLQNFLHIPLYAGLAISWLWALKWPAPHERGRLFAVFILTATWAVVDESYQMGIPGRYASLTDLTLNLVGASLAVGFFGLRTTRKR